MPNISIWFGGPPKWADSPSIPFDSISCPEGTFTIRLPKNQYFNIGRRANIQNKCVDATFFVGKTVVGTPTQVVQSACHASRFGGELSKYVEGENVWLISRDLCMLNNEIAYLGFPTRPRTFVVGLCLMRATSRMAKLLKEKVIPDLAETFETKVMDTRNLLVNWRVPIYAPITDDSIETVLLDNIESTL